MTITISPYAVRYVAPSEPIPASPTGKVVYVDLETYGGAYGDGLTIQANKIRLVILMSNDLYQVRNKEGELEEKAVVFLFDMLNATPEKWGEVQDYFNSYEIVCGHNLSFDLPILIRHGFKYPPKIFDTIIASRVLHNGLPYSHSLASLVKAKLDMEMPKDLQTSDWSVPVLSEEQLEYAAKDVAILPLLHNQLYERMEVFKLIPVYELECGVLAPVADMTLNGVKIDVVHWSERAQKAEVVRAELEEVILREFPRPDPLPSKVVRLTKKGEQNKADVKYNERIAKANAKRHWNLGSPVQVHEMFSKLGINLANTAYETLVRHIDDHPMVDKFLQWRDAEKQAGTFGMEWLKNLHPDGNVYPNWWQQGAASGRFSCSGPNMQQIPRGFTRKAITAEEGNVLVRADFSQIEARIAAKIAQDPVLIELFQKDEDIFIFTAKRVLGKLEVSPEERQIGKSLVYGLLFSMSAASLRVYCHVNFGVRFTVAEAEMFRDRFFRIFTGLARWHDRIRKSCNYAKEFKSLLGRRRIVAHLINNQDANMLGLGLNTPVQGTAADMLKMAVVELWARREEHPYAKRRMLVHDEIVMEAPEEKAQVVADWIKEVMVEAGSLILDPIPCQASVKIGKTWGG